MFRCHHACSDVVARCEDSSEEEKTRTPHTMDDENHENTRTNQSIMYTRGGKNSKGSGAEMNKSFIFDESEYYL